MNKVSSTDERAVKQDEDILPVVNLKGKIIEMDTFTVPFGY